MASLRCATAPASELLAAKSALQPNRGYGGGAGARKMCSVASAAGAFGGMKLLQARTTPRAAPERECRRRAVGIAAASAVEAAAEDTDTLVAELLERRRAIIQADESSRGFVITEVDTGGLKDWHASKVVAVQDVAAGVRCLTVETEVSRELVALENAFMKPGQVVQVRLNGKELKVVPSSAPFSEKINAPVLYKIRGDIPAGTTKLPQFSLSVKASVDIHVEEATTPELYNVAEGQELEVGPFESSGLDLRPILYLSRFPTLVFFAQGLGVAVARSIVEANDGDNGSMNLSFRDEVRFFYSAPKPSQLAYQDKFAHWESRNVKVRTTVDDAAGEEWQGAVGSLSVLWDEDDLEYDPNTTGAIVCVEKEARQEIMNLLEEAGIPKEQIVSWEY